MKFELSSNLLGKISTDGIVVFAFAQGKTYQLSSSLSQFDSAQRELIQHVLTLEQYRGKVGEIVTVYLPKRSLASRVYVVGLGKKDEVTPHDLRKTAVSLVRKTHNTVASLALCPLKETDVKMDPSIQGHALSEGLQLGTYQFAKYQKKEDKEKELEVVVFSESNRNITVKLKDGINAAHMCVTGTVLARDLVNEPAAVVTPTYLAKLAQDLAKKDPALKYIVYDRAQLEKMGMGAFLGIAQAADTPPKFIVLEYKPKKTVNGRKVAFVGKGITFDSGGINVKPGDHMQTMKIDMSGAAAVLGVFSVIGSIKPSFPVLGIIAATPNMISGKSIVPGDVVTAYNGKTIEILNTDAEGRVTLADSLSYAVKQGATEIIDVATLTGACEMALGTDIAGLFGNNQKLKDALKAAADFEGEHVWELPLPKAYKKLNKSDVADIANIPSSRYGGAITAALFLQEFIDKKPWVHLDIAGPAFLERPHELGVKGATGFGVRLLLHYLAEASV